MIKEGKFEEALSEVNSIIKQNDQEDNRKQDKKNFAHAYFMRGQINEKKGDMISAISDYKQALQINPSFVNAAFSKASCENKIGNFEEAIETYN